MQIIRIEADIIGGSFYCPFTGQEIIGEKGFTPSKATLFAYGHDDSEFFGPVHESLEKNKTAICEVLSESNTWGEVENGLKGLIPNEENILIIQLVDHPSSQVDTVISIAFNVMAVRDRENIDA